MLEHDSCIDGILLLGLANRPFFRVLLDFSRAS